MAGDQMPQKSEELPSDRRPMDGLCSAHRSKAQRETRLGSVREVLRFACEQQEHADLCVDLVGLAGELAGLFGGIA